MLGTKTFYTKNHIRVINKLKINFRQKFNKNNNNEEIGQCALSREDRSSRLDSFRVSTMDEEYIENQCIERGMRKKKPTKK